MLATSALVQAMFMDIFMSVFKFLSVNGARGHMFVHIVPVSLEWYVCWFDTSMVGQGCGRLII